VPPVESLASPTASAPNTSARDKLAVAAATAPVPAKILRPRAQAALVSPAMLEIEIDHKFAEAELSIWVDGRLSFTHALEGIDKKRLVVFHKVQGHEVHAMQVPAGKHLLRVQVSANSSAEQDDTVEGQFASGAEKLLRIQFDKSGKMNLNLQ
jgi:hypothetical protein